MIIHIAGAPGSGKSTLGVWIKNNYDKSKVIVFDIDDLYNNFIRAKEREAATLATIKKNWSKDMQKFIDEIVKKHQKSVLVFVGLNYPDPRIQFKNKEIFVKPFKLKLYADHKFYIDVPVKQLIEQRLTRVLNQLSKTDDARLKTMLKKNDKTIEVNIKEWVDDAKEWKSTFAKGKYKMMGSSDIKKSLTNIVK